MKLFRIDARRAILIQFVALVVFGASLSSFFVGFYVDQRNLEQRPRIVNQNENFTVPVTVKGLTVFVTPTEAEETNLVPFLSFGTLIVAATLLLAVSPRRDVPFHPIPKVRANLFYAQQLMSVAPSKLAASGFVALGFVVGTAFLVFAVPGIAQTLAEQHGGFL